MNLPYTLINLRLPIATVEQAIAEIGHNIPEHYIQLHIPYIDKLIASHSTILDHRYGLYTTSTLSGASVIHRDVRLSAINFALADCGSGADTVFFKPISNNPKFIKVTRIEPGQEWLSYLIEPTVEIARATLGMEECMLIDTQTPHVVRNSSRKARRVLSIDCKVSYKEAYEYFANLGLIELDILDSDRPVL
jgi:hypothetical protein